ncbi:hypothetical protein CRYUN_Cryun04dG0077900 [Craigia yunnanensis]
MTGLWLPVRGLVSVSILWPWCTVDEYDEALCPLDHETEGNLIDDEIKDTIVRSLPRGATLHAIIDACYSGTVLDLPLLCRMNKEGFYILKDKRNPLKYFSRAFTGTNIRNGAMTFSFTQAVQNELELTYGRLLNAMRNAISDVKAGLRLTGPIATLINKVLFGTTTQVFFCT